MRHGIRRAADFEGANGLQVFELEVDFDRDFRGIETHQRRPDG